MNEKFNVQKTVMFRESDVKRLNEIKKEKGFASNSATIRYLIKNH